MPKGNYSYSITSSTYNNNSPVTVPYSITCQKNLDFVYYKYDSLNRVTEEGEYETASLSDFSQTNADNTSFPTSGGILLKKYYYDTASPDGNASGQHYLLGRLSYSESYRLGSLAVRTSYSYDKMGRVEWLLHHGLGSYDKKLTYSYDWQGNITTKGYYDYDPSSSAYYTGYTYDKAGRLSIVKTSPNSNLSGATQEGLYTYMANGKPKRLQLANSQGVDYTYNSRDWLTMINDQNLSNGAKFGEVIGYDNISDIGSAQGVTAQYNGNISWQMYNMYGVSFSGTSLVGYGYTYDNANRLTKGDFGYHTTSWLNTNAFDENSLTYDNNGNILTLKRYNNSGSLQDNFTYNYTSGTDRLASLSGSSSTTYTYDDNGNVTGDSYRGIAFVIYDADNLPVTVYTTGGQTQAYSYDVNGNRIRKQVVGSTDVYYFNAPDGKTETVSWAASGKNYTYNIWGNDNIGQVRVTSSTNRYYYLKDHLGSIKVTVNSSGGVVGYDDYYPFGMTMSGRSSTGSADSRYKFVGNERDAETGEDYLGHRYYDSRIGRLLSVDPLAVKDPSRSPYSYAGNNPILFYDANGDTVAFHVDPNGAGGNGHTTLYYQNKKGEWYSYDQGAAGNNSSGSELGFVSNSDAKAGVDIKAVNGPAKGSLELATTKKQDEAISLSAEKSALEHNTGEKKYNLYSNNCTDAACDVVNDANVGIHIENPAMTVRPNSWFKMLKNVKIPISSSNNTQQNKIAPADNTHVQLYILKYHKVE